MLGIVAVLDVPIVIASVRLWRTIHPAVLVTKQGGHGLEDPQMVATLLVCLAAFTVLWVWLLLLRFAQLRTRSRIGALLGVRMIESGRNTAATVTPAIDLNLVF